MVAKAFGTGFTLLLDWLFGPWRVWTWVYWVTPGILMVGGLLIVAVTGGLYATIGAIGMGVGVYEFAQRWRR